MMNQGGAGNQDKPRSQGIPEVKFAGLRHHRVRCCTTDGIPTIALSIVDSVNVRHHGEIFRVNVEARADISGVAPDISESDLRVLRDFADAKLKKLEEEREKKS